MPNKSLGQHWLKDATILDQITNSTKITDADTVLEIGPGLGTLTSHLLRCSKKVIAVEFDKNLADNLVSQFPGKENSLQVLHEDILDFDLTVLPKDYIVVANVPYYITSKIVQKLMTAENKPKATVLLVQKEVAERIAAGPGGMSILAISAQVYAEAALGIEVPRGYFTPPPEVDSQVIILTTRKVPLINDEKQFFRLVKAGFSEKRKKLRSSLAGGLTLSKQAVDTMLEESGISLEARAQELSIDQWKELVRVYQA